MHAGMIGLGRMGGNMARRLARRGIFVHAFSLDAGANADLGNEENVKIENRIEDMFPALQPPRVVWMMVPAGAGTEENIQTLARQLSPGDIVIDGGNAHYRGS